MESKSCGPRTAEGTKICGAGAAPKGGTWMELVGGGLRPSQVHIDELVLAAVGLCWVPSAPDALQH